MVQLLNLGAPAIDFSPIGKLGDIIGGAIDKRREDQMWAGLADGMLGAPAAPQAPTVPQGRTIAEIAGGQGNGLDRSASAIAGIESGGRYDALGPVTKTGDRAYGKYQVMGANVPVWTEKYAGRRMTPEEFAANPQVQDAVFRGEFGRLSAKYGPEGAARAWFAGEGGMNDMGRKDQLGTSVGDYSRKFLAGGGDGADAPAPGATEVQGFNPPQGGAGGFPQMPAAGGPTPQQRETIRRLMLSGKPEFRQAGLQMLLSAQKQRSFSAPFEYQGGVFQMGADGEVRQVIAPRNPLDDQAKRLDIQQKQRALEGEGATPLTPQERAQIGIPEGQPAYKTRSGEIKFGPAGTKIVNEAQKAEGEFKKVGGKLRAERFDKIVQAGSTAQNTISDLNSLKDLAQGIETGKGAEFLAAIGPFAESLKIKIDGLGAMQAYKAIIARLAPTMRVEGSGATSDFEMRTFLEALPGLGKTPEGNALISQTMEAIAQHKVAAAEIASKALNGEIEPSEAEKQLRTLPNPLALWKEQNAKTPDAPKGSTGGPIPPAAARALMSRPELREEFDAKYGPGTSDRILGPRR